MPTIRLPSPLVLGLGVGIPGATQDILEMLRLQETRRRGRSLEEMERQRLAIQMAQAARGEQEFAERQRLEEEFGPNISLVQGALAQLQPRRISTPDQPAFAEPFVTGPLAEAIQAGGGAVGPVRPAIPGTPAVTSPDVMSILQDPQMARAVLRAGKVMPGLVTPQFAETKSRLQTEEGRMRKQEANDLKQQAAAAFGAKDYETGMLTFFRAVNLLGGDISLDDMFKLQAMDPELAREDATHLGSALEPFTRVGHPPTPAEISEAIFRAGTTRGPAGPELLKFVFKHMTELGPAERAQAQLAQAWQAEQDKLPAGTALSDVRKMQIAEEWTAKNPRAAQLAYESSPTYKTLVDAERYRRKVQVAEETKQAAIPPEERRLKRELTESQIAANRALAEQRKQERPGAKTERTQTEARAALAGPQMLSFIEWLAALKDAGFKTPAQEFADLAYKQYVREKRKPQNDPLGIR